MNVARPVGIHVYLDSNFLIGLYCARPGYRDAWTRLQVQSTGSSWSIATSHFALMEFVDLIQANRYFVQELHRRRPVNEIISQYRRECVLTRRNFRKVEDSSGAWIHSLCPTLNSPGLSGVRYDDLLELASVIGLNGPISAPDSIHLAHALLLGSNLIITNDVLFKRTVNEYLGQRCVLRRVAFEKLESITGTPVSKDELDGRGRIVEALKVEEFNRRF